ncbi:class I SAM-dependent methyltransferase [Haliangium sp.]|uniref:class I SAM-dependent methyltransferase n=1 Tax=Haliangium sp. TaxID=2663208 RepID=UPI003D0AA7D2
MFGSAHAEMLANRLRKRARHLRKWARRAGVSCYRMYDRDIPEIPLAIDWYQGNLHIARYQRRHEPVQGWAAWLDEMAMAAAAALEVESERVYCKERRRQRGAEQYQRQGVRGQRVEVGEGGHRFLVNLGDYLDTGLFLDHRPTRARVEAEAQDTRFLNLFCYTGAFTVYAAAGGARTSESVDLSQTYLDWARDNLAINRFGPPAHRLVRMDVFAYLDQARPDSFDLAVLDPPTFSNSKKMTGVLDLKRDHVALITSTLALLRRGGVLYFSTNARGFRLDEELIRAGRADSGRRRAAAAVEIEDITAATTDEDFRDHRPHQAWRLVRG